jgi:hypothetical protein
MKDDVQQLHKILIFACSLGILIFISRILMSHFGIKDNMLNGGISTGICLVLVFSVMHAVKKLRQK